MPSKAIQADLTAALALASRLCGPLDEALERLKRFHPKSMELTLGRIHRLLTALGNPQDRLPPVFHVAGTNGKGSTVAFMRAILEASGLAAHAYTSPHLVHYNERIRVAGQIIGDRELAALIDEVEAVNNGEPISFFEITTAIAMQQFARVPAAATLLETGLGGVLDATNVVDRPAATAITRISYDHVHILGNTIEAIAGEKAGILKSGVPVVVAWQRERRALDVVAARAAEIGAPLFEQGRYWDVAPTMAGFTYRDEQGILELPRPSLIGDHQLTNAGTAIAALRLSGKFDPDRLDYAGGMRAVEWPARLQRLKTGPLVQMLPAGWELWLDGGHNDSGGEVLGAQAATWQKQDGLRLDMVFAMLRTKRPQDFLKPLAPFVAQLRGVAIEGDHASLDAIEAASAARQTGIDAAPAADVATAIADLVQVATGPGRILICGSLYLAGQILANNG